MPLSDLPALLASKRISFVNIGGNLVSPGCYCRIACPDVDGNLKADGATADEAFDAAWAKHPSAPQRRPITTQLPMPRTRLPGA